MYLLRMNEVRRRAIHLCGGAALASALVAGSAIEGATQQAPRGDNLALVSPLVGRWTGTTDGQPGTGTVEREYERVLGDTFIRVQNRSTYPPQPKNTTGEAHQDLGSSATTGRGRRSSFASFTEKGL